MPNAMFGTHALEDLLERNETIMEFGPERLVTAIRTSIEAHNDAINDFLNPLVRYTNQREEPYGAQVGTTRVRGQRVDEFGAVDAMLPRMPPVAVSNIGYPLYRIQYAWQFTRDFMETESPRQAAIRLMAIQQGDLDRIEFEVRNAFFNPVSELTYRDQLIDQLVLPIRRLANGDSQQLPLGPNGEVFNPATHTHYMGRAGGSLVAADVDAAVHNVLEHGVRGALRIYINVEDEPLIRAFPNFYPFEFRETYTPLELLPESTVLMRDRGPLVEGVDPSNPENMRIGRWNAKYEVATRPWVYPGYIMVVDTGRRPLVWRSRQNPSAAFGAQGRANLRVVGAHDRFPLEAEWMEREFGVSVGDRVAAALLYINGTSYVMPTIALPPI